MTKAISTMIVFLLFGFSMLIVSCSQKVPQENILAEFKGGTVTADELEQEISELSEWKQKQYKDQAGREEYLTLMAESRMLLQVAVEKALNKDSEIVKQTREYKDQLMVKELVKREVDDKVKVNDADVKQYYEENKADYLEPEKVAVTEITVKEEEKAKEIMEKIKGGADFAELAKEMDAKGESFGPGQGNEGKTRPFSRDSFSAQEFVEAAFSLGIGEMSDIVVQPVRDETYYMIVRLDERIPPRQKEFSEVESKISRDVEKEKKKERMDRWLETLKVDKKFYVYPDRIPEIEIEEEKTAEIAETESEQEPPGEEAKEEESSGEQKVPDEAAEEEKPDTKEEK